MGDGCAVGGADGLGEGAAEGGALGLGEDDGDGEGVGDCDPLPIGSGGSRPSARAAEPDHASTAASETPTTATPRVMVNPFVPWRNEDCRFRHF